MAFVTLLGCATEEPAHTPEVAEIEQQDDEEEASGSPLTLSDDVARLAFGDDIGEFPHGAHGGIVCSQCHTAVEGHDTHQAVACADCHQGSAFLGERVVFARNECLACHHGAEQVYSCERCHASLPAAVARTETVHLAVWPEPRERVLSFDHTSHETLDCGQCHSQGVRLTFSETCVTCHQDHHQPTSDCSTCHGAVPLETHELEVHLGCSGAQCHQDALPAASELSRSSCLTCHTAQVDHEPEDDCATCHRIGPTEAALAGGGRR